MTGPPLCWLCSCWHSPGHSAFTSSLPGSCWLRFSQVCVPQDLSPCSTELLPSQALPACFLLDVSLFQRWQGRCPDWISLSLLTVHFSHLAHSKCSPVLEHISCIPPHTFLLQVVANLMRIILFSFSDLGLSKAPCNHLQTLACNFFPSVLNYKLKLLQVLHKKPLGQ